MSVVSPNSNRQSAWRLTRVAPWLLLSWSATASAERWVRVVCSELDQERSAEVEARIRAGLLTSSIDAEKVVVTCEGALAKAEIDAGDEHVQHSFSIAGADPRDSLIQGVQDALREVAIRRSAALSPSETPSGDPPKAAVESTREQPSTVLPTTLLPTPATTEGPLEPRAHSNDRLPQASRRSSVQIGAFGTFESWADGFTIGPALSVAYATPRLSLDLSAGRATLSPSRPAFDVVEWYGDVRLAWQPRWAWKVRGQLGAGPSLVVVSPQRDLVAPRAGTTLVAWFAEASLSRPIWFGRIALVPSFGARMFASERTVTVDAAYQFKLAGVVPRLAMGVVVDFEKSPPVP